MKAGSQVGGWDRLPRVSHYNRYGLFGLASIPLIWCAGIVLFAARARMALGYWPSPSHPDPKLLGFANHYGLLEIGMFASVAALPLLMVGGALSGRAERSRAWGLFFAGWALILALTFLPPVNFVMWYLD